MTTTAAATPRYAGRTTAGTGLSYAVLLDDAPGSRVQRSALCANDADAGAAIALRATPAAC